VTFTLGKQVSDTIDPAFTDRLRAVQEDFVCALLHA
jgi:hypothetical protein